MASGEEVRNVESAEASVAVSTRKRMRAATPLRGAEQTALQAALQEINQLRQEQRQQRADFEALLQQRDEEIRRMTEQRNPRLNQLSHFHIRETPTEISENRDRGISELGYKVKPDIFDGSVPLREYFVQFNLIARANGWNDSFKAVALASNLRGKARSVLDGVFEIEDLSYQELKNKLELRFGEGHLAQTYYTQFTNRKQKSLEDLPSLAADLERLSRLAYPECSHGVRDKIACAQFIAALSDGFLKRTLQLENISSLKSAVERAMAVKVIQENSFPRKYENRNFYGNNNKDDRKASNNFVGGKFNNNKGKNNGSTDKVSSKYGNKAGKNKYFNKNENFQKNKTQRKECWNCGSTEHFRSECPSLLEENKG